MYSPYINSCIVEIPKCASTSLRNIVSSFFVTRVVAEHATLQQHITAFPSMKMSYALVRDPIDRLKSSVQYRMDRYPDGISIPQIKQSLLSYGRGERPSFDDLLFYPQYSFLMSDFPVSLYKIDNVNFLLEDIGISSPAPVENASRSKISTDQLLDGFGENFINEFYSIDFSLYRGVSCAGGRALCAESAKGYIYSLRGGAQ